MLYFFFTLVVVFLGDLVPWQDSWRFENAWLCIVSVVEAVFVAVLYEHLLVTREGGDTEAIVNTFE